MEEQVGVGLSDELRVVRGESPAARVALDKSSGSEQHAAFVETVRRREARLAEATDAVLADLLTPREERFAEDQVRLFREAQWLSATGQFPNGGPLHQQGPLQVAAWEIFLSAINERTYGGSESGGDNPDYP